MSSQSIEDPEHLYDSEDLSHGEVEWDMENTDEILAAHWNVNSMNETPDLDEGPLLFNPANMEPEPIFPAIQTLRFATSWAVDLCPNAERAAGDGQTFLAKFRQDGFVPYCMLNLYYPFSSPEDWQMANFLLTSHLSMRAINDFLSIKLVHLLSWLHCTLFSNCTYLPVTSQRLCLFHSGLLTSKELCSHAEMLPSGPAWKVQIIPTTHPTKQPVHFYYCDSLDCIELLFNNLLFASEMDLSLYCLFTTMERVVQLYTE
ncbi:hypothetical protein JVT61DRAFT_9451 [Boletus reticuloceps]|uniref:Uncharacterized protein n=1 Tax=Boletus reticuloceps TaxID=495285 RepID=A0A8I3A5P6_9AGAM|nr:hypothetical protein JVT61DRAFT_9451 [Boletus reticuloceps]